ncbi:SGNH/GDSL hydrolase family protein [Nocardia sp. NPDC005366]|uniref:SGNH/GDSL hydrolase family protein n=1 Tax=Nocardia sp. NPDC005366 TaxID=3156878 RepID=UPI0033B23E12
MYSKIETRFTSRWLPGFGLIAAALALIVSSCPRTDNAIEYVGTNSVIEYVALGDSRAAAPDKVVGPGLDGCGRSANGYPVQIADLIRPTSFTDMSCAGATSPNILTTAQVTTSPDGRRHDATPQISALSARTTLVTISIGGNDLRWWDLVSPCFPPEQNTDAKCRLDSGVQDRVDRRLTELAGWIDADLDAVVAKSPKATVVVVGHGGIYGPRGCGATATFSALDAAWVADFFATIDQVLRVRATAHNARFVDVRNAAVGHDACAPPESRWFEGNVSTSSTPIRHPTPLGSRAIATLVVDAIR